MQASNVIKTTFTWIQQLTEHGDKGKGVEHTQASP